MPTLGRYGRCRLPRGRSSAARSGMVPSAHGVAEGRTRVAVAQPGVAAWDRHRTQSTTPPRRGRRPGAPGVLLVAAAATSAGGGVGEPAGFLRVGCLGRSVVPSGGVAGILDRATGCLNSWLTPGPPSSLKGVCDVDLEELDIELPRRFGRD